MFTLVDFAQVDALTVDVRRSLSSVNRALVIPAAVQDSFSLRAGCDVVTKIVTQLSGLSPKSFIRENEPSWLPIYAVIELLFAYYCGRYR